jgi:hypothetical protein
MIRRREFEVGELVRVSDGPFGGVGHEFHRRAEPALLVAQDPYRKSGLTQP